MKKLSSAKKLLLSAFGLVLMLTFAVGTTLAWFTMSQEVAIDGIELQAKSGDSSLLVSLTYGTDYKSSVNLASSVEYGPMITNARLGDITWDSTGSKFTYQDGSAVAAPNSSGGEYFDFTLYFRSNVENRSVALIADTSNDSKVSPVGTGSTLSYVKAWREFTGAQDEADYGISGTIAAGSNLVTRASNAVRIKFDNTEAGGNKIEKIWEPNSQSGFGGRNRNMAQDYLSMLYNGFVLPGSPTTPNYTTVEDNDINNVQLVKLVESPTMSGFYEGTLKISVWLEGHDADCFNSILRDVFETFLKFSLVPTV